jgi:hypothetical protein
MGGVGIGMGRMRAALIAVISLRHALIKDISI